jgi:hypothetical protein
LFERHGGRWTHEVIATPGVAYVRVAYAPESGVELLAVHVDTSKAADRNSLFLYEQADSWIPRLLVVGGDEPVHEPTFARSSGQVTIGWWSVVTGASGEEQHVARAIVNRKPPTTGRAVTIADDVERLLLVPETAAGPLWVVDRVSGAREIQFLASVGDSTVGRGAFANPFEGYFRIAGLTDTDLLIAGPLHRVNDGRHSVVTSLIRVEVTCST